MKFIVSILALMMLVGCVGAIPVLAPPMSITSNSVDVQVGGAAGTCWFEYGMQPSPSLSWRTKNQTPVAANCLETIHGSPLLGGTLFYFRGCDTTGCSADSTFTTLAVTPIPTTTFGSTFDNLTESNMDISLLGYQATAPYTWLFPTLPSLMWGMVFSFIFIGLWLRGRSVTIPSILGFLIGVFIFSVDYGLGIGIPPELAAIGQGAMYAAIAGVILSLIKK